MQSRISQMRNGAIPSQQQMPRQQPSPQQLNQSIENIRGMMQQIKNAPNQQAMLAQMLQNNPNTAMLSNMLKGGGSLENIARQMAQMNGIDINELINSLQNGF